MKFSKTGLYWTFPRLEIKTIDTYRDRIPSKTLNFTDFQNIMSKCGQFVHLLYIYFTGSINSDYHKLIYSFEDVEYLTDENFQYQVLLDICIQTCTNLRKLEIRKYLSRGCIDLPHVRFDASFLPQKLLQLSLVNKKLHEIHMDCSTSVDLEIIQMFQNDATVIKNLYLNWFNYTGDSLCEVRISFLDVKSTFITLFVAATGISENQTQGINDFTSPQFDKRKVNDSDSQAFQRSASTEF